MLMALVHLVAGLVLTSLGADGFVRGAASLAYRLGVSTLVIGLTVVAFGTSAPELLVCISAALDGSTSLAMGNAVGSNIFNTAAILGFSAMIFPIACHIALIRREVPIMLAAGVLLFGLVLIGPDRTVTRGEGILMLVLFVAYIFLTYVLAQRERKADLIAAHVDASEDVADQPQSWARDAMFLVGGVALLVFGAKWMVSGAVTIARVFGVSELIIGLTIVGAGTGLPELATSIAAALRKQSDLAIGNVVGSNIFNILLILGVTSVVVPVPAEPDVVRRDLPVMVGLFALTLPLMISRRTIGRRAGALLFGMYIAYVGYLIASA